MSIIPHVTWDEFTTITGAEQFRQFTEKGDSIVLFITDWSYPSRLTLKRIKKLHFDKKKCGVVDVDLVDSNQLVDRFQIKSVPYCVVMKEGQLTQTIVGLRFEQLREVFAGWVGDYRILHPSVSRDCPEGHPLTMLTELPASIYAQGYFYCNGCRKVEQCCGQQPVAHCEQCDYDLCGECMKDPPQ